ncbi:MAG: hypothetical protein IPL31_09475 [Saprospiraceae bacterium]|nr:hypothetical protein [Saprospiraceae bacterium]
MSWTPIAITVSIFAVFVLFNIYIRVKTFGMYKELVQKRIQFNFSDIFSGAKWNVVMQAYPTEQQLLSRFRNHMISTGILFIIVIVLVLLLLFYLRNFK